MAQLVYMHAPAIHLHFLHLAERPPTPHGFQFSSVVGKTDGILYKKKLFGQLPCGDSIVDENRIYMFCSFHALVFIISLLIQELTKIHQNGRKDVFIFTFICIYFLSLGVGWGWRGR